MGPNQTYKLLYSKGNHKQNEKTTYRLGENICKWCDWQSINFQDTQTAHTIQQQQQKQKQTTQSKNGQKGFSGGTVVQNPPANAEDTGSSPGLGRSHMPWSNQARVPQLLSLHARAREPQLLSPLATTTEACTPRVHAPQQEKPPQWEARAPQGRVALLATTRKSSCAATKTQHSQK